MKKVSIRPLVGTMVLTGLASIYPGLGCSHVTDDCNLMSTCAVPDAGKGGSTGDPGGTNSGGAGTTGTSDASSGGNNAGASTLGGAATGGVGVGGTNNVGGIGAGGLATGGAGTGGVATGGVPTCSPACGSTKAVCDLTHLTCVECLSEGNCSAPKPGCNLASNACVQCTKKEHCSGTTSVCDTARNACVGCLSDGDCSGSTPACNTATNTCVPCMTNDHCASPNPLCDAQRHTCVQCLDNNDCPSATASVCRAGTCSPCATNTDCSHVGGKSVCKVDAESDAGTNAGTCVECTGTDYEACSDGDAGPGRVCDSLRNVCSDKGEHAADLCQPCVSDAQCKPGELCVEEKVNGKSLGHFCFWKQGDTGNNAPAVCGDTGRPYVTATSATSIDEQPATICSLAASTCTGMNQYRSTNCASPTNTADDNLCGTLPGVDSKCVSFTSTQYRCTVACGSDDDCPIIGITPITCSVTSGAHKYCSL